MFSLIRLAAGFAFGWLFYMILMAITVYDGVPSLIFQPIIGAVMSSGFVVLSYLAGFVVRSKPLSIFWSRLGPWVLLGPISGFTILFFGTDLGLTDPEINPDTQETIQVLGGWITLIAYFLTVFPIVNWPRKAADK
jgi:hypothetical protein